MQKWLLFILSICTILTVTACSNDSSGSTSEDRQPEAEEPEKQEPEESGEATYENTYPLTGEQTNEEVNNRAVAVMVNNHPKARPQTGLTQADMVYEILAEGDITRLIAFFQSEKPEEVGPVRSAREYYFNRADAHNALYVYHGAANFIEDQLKAGIVDNINGAYHDNDGNLFRRDSNRQAPHNSYLLFDRIYDAAEKKGYETTQEHQALPFLSEENKETIDGENAQQVSVSYSKSPSETIYYKYDEAKEHYLRYNGKDQTVDLNTNEAVQLDNVFILETHHEVIDDAGRRSIDFESGGNAYLLQKGKIQEVQWKNVDGQVLPYRDGEPVKLVPGKTWINVVPEDTGLNGAVNIQTPDE